MSAKVCKIDSDCFASKDAPTSAEKVGTCCAYMKITKLDTTKPAHAAWIQGLKDKGYPHTDGADMKYCEDNYPQSFGAAFLKDDAVADGSVWANAGIWFKAYCDGGETLAFVGKLTAATGMIYMSLN